MRLILWAFGFLIAFGISKAFAQPVVISEQSPMQAGQGIYAFEDKDRSFTIADVRKAPEIFKHTASANYGYTASAIWVRVAVDNQAGEKAYLQVLAAGLDSITCYVIAEDGNMRVHETGYRFPFEQREMRIGFPTFELPMGGSEVYLCLRGEETIQAPIRIVAASKLLEVMHQYDVMSSILVGIVFLMLAYSSLLWLSTREIVYIYYLPLLLVIGLSMLRISGYDQWLLPFIKPFSRALTPLLSMLSIPFYMHFLNITRRNYKGFFWMYAGFGGCYAIILLLELLGFPRESSNIMSLLALLIMPATLFSAFYVYAKGYKPALYFIAAYSALLVGVAVIILSSMGALPNNNWTANSLSIGSAVQVILFTLAIADKQNRYKQEAIDAQMQALQLAETHAHELEDKVQERTAALVHANEELQASEEELRQNSEELLATNQMLEEQKRQIEENSALMHAMLQSAGLMVITTDIDGTIISFNAMAEKTLQYEASEVVGKHSPAIFHDINEVVSRAASLSEELNRTIEPGFGVFVSKALVDGMESREWTYTKKDGTRFPVALTITPVRAHGDLLGYMGVAEDISLRHAHLAQLQQQQEQLRASEEELRQNLEELQATQEALSERNKEIEAKERQLRQIFNGAPAMIYQFKMAPNGAMSFPLVSRGSMDIYGLSPEALMADATSIIGKIYPEDQQKFQQSVMESAQNLTIWHVQLRSVVDGKISWIEGTSMPERQADGSILWSGMVVNIDDRKRMESEIMAKQDELLTKNSALLASEEELRQNAEELLAVNERIAEEKKRAEEALMALKETQNQLVQAEKMSSLGQLTAGVAHEINNPVNFISGGTQTLKIIVQDIFELLNGYSICEVASTDEERRAALQGLVEVKQRIGNVEELKEDAQALISDIDKGVDRVVEIVRGLKNFSRGDDSAALPADVHEMIDASLIILRNKFKDRIEVVQDYDKDLPQLQCYAGQLNQVFMNMVGNAIDAISGKGTITISTRNRPKHIEISIKDTGKGMPEQVKKRIFDPFFTTKPIGQGTGLGLSISYGIIEKHKGTIDVHSEEGKGTEFLIALPK